MKIDALQLVVTGTSWRNLIVVKLTTDAGLVGYGEATIEYGDRALLAYLPEIYSRAVHGRDPCDVAGVLEAMEHADYWRSGFIARTAFSGIELACWDLKGQAEGKPVWQLLGAKRSQPLRAYANGWYRDDRDPDRIAELAARVVNMGYTAMKIDPFGAGLGGLTPEEWDRSLAIIRQVRRRVGDAIELFVEGHGRFDLETACRLAKAMEPQRPGFFEEPLIPELNHHLPELVKQTSIPIAIGERLSTPQLFEWVTAGCERLVLQPDICHIGGIQGLMRVARFAEDRGWSVAPHNAGGPLATTHAVHFGVHSGAVAIQEVFDDFEDSWVRDAFPGRSIVRDGLFEPSTEPGFGVVVDEDLLSEYPLMDQHLDLFAAGWEKRAASAMS